MPYGNITRREFLKISGLLAGGLVWDPKPSLQVTGDGSKPKVVHIYSSQTTNWDFSTGWYGDYVDQNVVYEMIDWGAMQLTGTANRAAAWQALIPAYVPGERVAIKVNLNNAGNIDDSDNFIDALIQPVNGVIKGLTEIGVAESDIWVYDAIRAIPDRFQSRCAFPGVQFSGRGGYNSLGFNTLEFVTFHPPNGVPPLGVQRISNVLAGAHYLINMPIMKKHRYACVSLSFKNHLGSIHDCAVLHDYIFPDETIYTPDYNPMLDIYKNQHFVGKTVLTIGDGLFGSKEGESTDPKPWTTFGDQAPNSLFFSQDPVAIDCVMCDFLEAEAGVPPSADDYLALAAQAGLGVFEHRAPGVFSPQEWYSLIDYVYVNLDRLIELNAWCREQTAHLSWTQPPHPDLAGYRIHYTSETGGPANEGASPVNVPHPGQLALNLTGLTMYSLYELWIEPYDGSGNPLAESNHAFILPTDISFYLPLVL
jgi:hypothetical protein